MMDGPNLNCTHCDQSGKERMQFTHSSGSLADQMRNSSSATWEMGNLRETIRTPKLFSDKMN